MHENEQQQNPPGRPYTPQPARERDKPAGRAPLYDRRGQLTRSGQRVWAIKLLRANLRRYARSRRHQGRLQEAMRGFFAGALHLASACDLLTRVDFEQWQKRLTRIDAAPVTRRGRPC